jgi:hypothetical protein
LVFRPNIKLGPLQISFLQKTVKNEILKKYVGDPQKDFLITKTIIHTKVHTVDRYYAQYMHIPYR